MSEPSAESYPERALWASVILRAFQDLQKRTDPEGINPQIQYDRSFSWINNSYTKKQIDTPSPEHPNKKVFETYKTGDVGGFEWVCDHLDLSPSALRAKSLTRAGVDQIVHGLKVLKAKSEEDEV